MLFGKQLTYKNAVITICAFAYLVDYYTLEKPPVDKNLFFNNLYKILIDMQEHSFVHCDFSKRNIMVNKKCDIKLIDFGLSHIKEFDNEELYKHMFWGSGFTIDGNVITYDDIVALQRVLLRLYPDCINEDCYKNILSLKGKNIFVTRIK